MPTVDLTIDTASFEGNNSGNWNNTANLASVNGAYMTSTGVNSGELRSFYFGTNAAAVIPADAVLTDLRLVTYVKNSLYLGHFYIKYPGGFSDGGQAAHTTSFGTSSLALEAVSANLLNEKPITATELRTMP